MATDQERSARSAARLEWVRVELVGDVTLELDEALRRQPDHRVKSSIICSTCSHCPWVSRGRPSEAIRWSPRSFHDDGVLASQVLLEFLRLGVALAPAAVGERVLGAAHELVPPLAELAVDVPYALAVHSENGKSAEDMIRMAGANDVRALVVEDDVADTTFANRDLLAGKAPGPGPVVGHQDAVPKRLRGE